MAVVRSNPRRVAVVVAGVVLGLASPAWAQDTVGLTLRGKPLTLHLYGPATGVPVLVASGDGGWVHLGPRVAELLSRSGHFVVGLDSKQYLSAFTDGARTLSVRDVPADFRVLVEYASARTRTKPVLVGVSEGAGLAVLAATDAATQRLVSGVIGLGLPDLNELGWRWRDAVIYITKGVPNEPTFSVAGLIDRVAPLPLALIHSTGDEFVPLAVAQQMIAKARPPSRLWVITASNHRFSGNEAEFERRLAEAMAWVTANTVR